MFRMKSKKWNVLAIVLGVGAFFGTFYVAYAGIVQWSREQPATISAIAVDVLPPDSITVFQDEALTDELIQGEILEFPPILSFHPPLTGLVSGNRSSVELWLRNNSEIPLAVTRICCPAIFDPVTGEFLTSYSVDSIPCCAPSVPINTGEVQPIGIAIFDPDQTFETVQFNVVIGAVGEVTDAGIGVTNISPQLQSVLESSATKESER